MGSGVSEEGREGGREGREGRGGRSEMMVAGVG
jgi:hypothetical protein